ncbi:MAG: VanW family protein [Parcubacteria group bacterium]|jgi:vancomycin resistance protein YoaR
MRKNKVEKIFYIFVFSLLYFVPSNFALAENINLGSFDQQTANEKFLKDISLKVDDSSYNLSAEEIKKFIQESETLTYSPSYRSEIENTNFCAYQKSIICNLLFSATDAIHIQKISSVYLDESAISQYLDDFALEVNKDPENAKLQADDGKVSVFALSRDGIQLDKEKSLQIIDDYFKGPSKTNEVSLAYKVIKPEISTDSIENLGITALIGEGTSNFAGSPKNRIHNITVGTKRFNGVLIKPGEEFSFIKALGPVDESTGYLPELVIKQDKTEPDYGGGMCQVSTTAFRAAIMSGLKITARTPHAYPVSYYNPQGMDATVFIPNPDLKFLNNTPGYILMQTKIEGTKLIFDFYGTSDGRKINITGPTITERNPDGSMKATFTQEVLDKDGNQILHNVFNSSYDSPSKYPHPGEEIFKEKPKDWSKKQWEAYKKLHNL